MDLTCYMEKVVNYDDMKNVDKQVSEVIKWHPRFH